jgi:hypothetical protein
MRSGFIAPFLCGWHLPKGSGSSREIFSWRCEIISSGIQLIDN